MALVSRPRPSIHSKVSQSIQELKTKTARSSKLTLRHTGVMRFLQTEWHRHERDRNAWEIEKQEMRARIANLEGQARRADATQKALKRYVSILEKKVKEQSAALKSGGKDKGVEDEAEAEDNKTKLDRSALIQEKLRRKHNFVILSVSRF